MSILSAPLRRIVTLVIVVSAASAASAQLPANSDVWKDRCNLLASSSNAIQSGTTPAELVAATRGVTSRGFLVLAINRAQAGQHYVACTMYYLAAISERAGNGGVKPNLIAAGNDAIVAGSELKLARGQHLRMKEHTTRIAMRMHEMTGQPLTLTPPETSAVLDAATTTPVVLTPVPPANQEALDTKSR